MRKLIVGCGYLGVRIARTWLQAGDEVIALTRSAERAARLQNEGISTRIGDVTDPASLVDLPEVDVLLYAIGYDRRSGLSRSQVTVDGLKNLLDRMADRVGRFLHISSTSVYGQTDGCWVDETSECQPERENGRLGLQAERLVWTYFPTGTDHRETLQRSACVLRLAGIYGPGRLLSRIDQLKEGTPLAGNPDAFLNLIHVDDAAQAVLACERQGEPGATYLVCDDRPIRRREYYELLAELVGAPKPTFADVPVTSNPPPASSVSPRELSRGLNKRCRNDRMRRELQVELLYPTIASGLPHAIGDSNESPE